VIDELDGPDLGVTEERCADPAMCVGLKPDRYGVVHPFDMILDTLDDVPDLLWRRRDLGGHEQS